MVRVFDTLIAKLLFEPKRAMKPVGLLSDADSASDRLG